MELTRDAVLADLALLPENYKTGDVVLDEAEH